MANFDVQAEEIFALRSIYDEDVLILEDEEPPRGRFIIDISLPSEFKIRDVGNNKRKGINFGVHFLPPLNLCFELPATYPSETCPAFFLTCCWLTLDNLSKLCEELESMWKKGNEEVILFQWISFLKEEMLQFLNITDFLDISRTACYKSNSQNVSFGKNISSVSNELLLQDQSYNSNVSLNAAASVEIMNSKNQLILSMSNIKPNTERGSGLYDQRAVLDLTNGLVSFIQEYNRYRKLEVFRNNLFTCLVCFTLKRGYEFTRFKQCEHMYCSECLKSYFEIQIKEGNVCSLNCPHEKCPSQADGTQVKELVSSELFNKYDNLLLSRTLDGMSDIEYCPRQACQCPVLIEPGVTMGCCPKCKFTFCILCRAVYHGVAPCNFKNSQQVCKEYLNSRGKEREALEKRYGKKVLKVLAENVLSENWKDTHSKKCPHCQTNIEKYEGCNKMTCFKCNTYFCWICMEKLNSANPYCHFSDPKSSCYNQLFPPDQFFDDVDIEYVEPGEFLIYIE